MQIVPAFQIEAKDYAIIGKLHVKENPESAKSLLDSYKQASSKALDTNLKNLNYYFLVFCKIFDLTPLDYLGQLYVQDKVEKRRLFISAMIVIYKPQIITFDINSNSGLAQYLCSILQFEPSNMSKTIDEALVLMDNNLYGFMDDVTKLVGQLQNYKNGYGLGPNLFDMMENKA